MDWLLFILCFFLYHLAWLNAPDEYEKSLYEQDLESAFKEAKRRKK